MTSKVRENRLRRVAERQGLILIKSRRRDPRALGYGLYALVRTEVERPAAESALASGVGVTLDEVESTLS